MDLGSALRRSAAKTPHKTAIICQGKELSYEALDRSTDALARWLLQQVQPGGRVALHWCNSFEIVKLYFACFKAGLIAVPVNNRLKTPEIAYILAHSKAKLCFSQPELAPLSEAARAECFSLQALYTALPEEADLAAAEGELPEVSPYDVAAILYTSGTTARPKGVMHTPISLFGSAQLMIELGMNESDTVLAATQMVHIAALACVVLPGIFCGATVAVLPAFDASSALDVIQASGCTMVTILPAMLRFLVEEQGRNSRDVSTIRCCLAGGDTVPVTLQQRFRELFGIPVRELYGMTESVPITCIDEAEPRDGSVGRAVPMVETRVADLSGNVLANGRSGELQVQSPANCVGYWDDPISTAATFTEGWLRTGDLARRDDDGFFWFEGRVKQIIVRGGSNISPQEVEEALYHHPAVLEAGVIGMPDPVHGEKVIAFVALRDGMPAGEEELRELVRGRIADYKTPERILFLSALPKGLTGKVQRRELKDVAVAALERGVATGA